ncbi:TAGLN3, partial [Symbiodinium sp. CCMP2456]
MTRLVLLAAIVILALMASPRPSPQFPGAFATTASTCQKCKSQQAKGILPRRSMLSGSAMLGLVVRPESVSAQGQEILRVKPNLFGPPAIEAVGWLLEATTSVSGLADTLQQIALVAAFSQMSSDVRKQWGKVADLQDNLSVAMQNSEMELTSKMRLAGRKARAALKLVAGREMKSSVFDTWPVLLRTWDADVKASKELVDRYVQELLVINSQLRQVQSDIPLVLGDNGASENISFVQKSIDKLETQRRTFVGLAEEADLAEWELSLTEPTESSVLEPLLKNMVLQVDAVGRPAGDPGESKERAYFREDVGSFECLHGDYPLLGTDGYCYKCRINEVWLGSYLIGRNKKTCSNCIYTDYNFRFLTWLAPESHGNCRLCRTFMEKYVPVVALLLLLSLLPYVFELISFRYERYKVKSEQHRIVLNRYFGYLMATLYVAVVIGSVWNTFELILKEPPKALGLVRREVPRVAIYFITFVLARVGISLPILLFYPGLFKGPVHCYFATDASDAAM